MKSFDVGLTVVDGVGKVTKDGELIVVKSFAVGLVVVNTVCVTMISLSTPSHQGPDICTGPVGSASQT